MAWLYLSPWTYSDPLANQNGASLETSAADSDGGEALDSTPGPEPARDLPDSATTSVPERKRAVSRESQERIERILEIADLHLAMGRFVTPSGSNAAEAYLGVASLDPANERAVRGLDRVTDGVIDEARALVERGNREGAIELLDAALTQLPNARRLKEVLGELNP